MAASARSRWSDLPALLGAALGRCPNCGERGMFDRLYRVRRTCLGCGVRFERDVGSWLVALVLTYTFAILVLVAEAMWILPRYGLFPGIEWVAIGTGALAVILSYRPIKGASIWFLWASGVVTRDGETEVTPGKRLG